MNNEMRAVKKRQGEILAFLCCSIMLKALELKGTYTSRLNGLKSLAKLFKFVFCNPCQFSPSLTILVPLWFIIISLQSIIFRFPVILSMPQITQNTVSIEH